MNTAPPDALGHRGEPTCRLVPVDGSRYQIDHVLGWGPVDLAAKLGLGEPVRLAGGRRLPPSDHVGVVAKLRLG